MKWFIAGSITGFLIACVLDGLAEAEETPEETGVTPFNMHWGDLTTHQQAAAVMTAWRS